MRLLVRPTIQIAVVIDRVVVRPVANRPREPVDRILADAHGRCRFRVAQVLSDRFTHDRRDAHAAPFGLVAQLLVALSREAKIGGRVPRHDSVTDIAISPPRQGRARK